MSESQKWKKIDAVFKLKTPLHIGYIPSKGSVVSPTRYYVPGRNFWGAVTKRITEYLYTDPIKDCKNNDENNKDGNNKTTCYQKIGKEIKNNFRFSYFYLFDGRTIYFPHYTNEGLKYGNLTKSEFEHRFISSRISTAINESGTAKDESLHEIEFINNKFKDVNGDFKDVMIACRIWVNEDTKINGENIILKDKGLFIGDFNIIQEFILGGESKYGFGHVVLESVNKVKCPIKEIDIKKESNDKKDDEKKKEVIIEIETGKGLPAHLKYNKNLKFKGDIELIAGRGYYDPNSLKKDKSEKNKDQSNKKPGQVISKPEYYLSPGTILIQDKNEGGGNYKFKINWDGTLEAIGDESN